jgi:hypothetical protein
MQNKIKNSETPYFSTSPVHDQFGTLMVAFGITKREKLAMEIFLCYGIKYDNPIPYISECYELADKFLNFEEEDQKENLSKIIL